MAGIGQVFYCVFIDLDLVSVNKNAKKNEASIQPSSRNKLGQYSICYMA